MTAPVLDPWTPPSLEPHPQQPAAPSRGRRRAAALVLAGAVAGAAAGGGTAVLVGRTPVVAQAAGITTTTAIPGSAGAGSSAEQAAAAIAPSVVTISVTGRATGQFGGSRPVADTGSGIVLRADGYILTNNHVISAASNGGTVSVTTSNGTTYPATIVGTDPTSDLAVVRVQGGQPLTPAVFAKSSELRVGQPVLAVGAPLGLSNTVTEGIVSTLNRPVRTGEPGASQQSVIDAIQTDAAINPGNSGGALVDLAGHVVGVNTAIATTGSSAPGAQSGNIGVGFAIPSDSATKVAEQLISTGKAIHPQLGISVTDAAGNAGAGVPGAGALVRAVTPGGPAAQAGLQAGDVITKVGNRVVTDADSLIVAVRAHDPGQSVTITYTRNGQTRTATASLTAAPTP